MQMLGRQLDLSPNFFGVKIANNLMENNSPTNIGYLKLIVLQFRAEKPANASKDEVEEWERSVANFANKFVSFHNLLETLIRTRN